MVNLVEYLLNQPSSWYAWNPAMKLFQLSTESQTLWLRVEWVATLPVKIKRRMTHRGWGLSRSERTSLSICATTEIEHDYQIDHNTVVRRPSHMAFTMCFLLGYRKSKQMRRPCTLTMHIISSLWTSIIVIRTTMVTHLCHGSLVSEAYWTLKMYIIREYIYIYIYVYFRYI